jgi:probable O-glycosylation ligase (exosortase A-associated)
MSACTISILNSFERLRLLVLTIAASFGFYVLKAFPFILTTGGAFRLFGPPQSMVADNNDFGLALDMTLPLFFFLAQTESRPWAKRLFAFLFIITIPAIFFTYSRGALVGLISLFLVMLAQSRRRFALLPVAVFAVAVAVYFAPGEWQDRMNPNRPEALDASARSRLDSWAFARALAADYPITGGGFATFTAELYDRYAPSEHVAVIGSHSVYFQVLAEHGYVGLSLYLLVVVTCLVTIRRVRKTAIARGDINIAHYAQMFQFSMVAFLAAGTFLGRAYFDYFFTIIVCVVTLRHIANESWAATRVVEKVPGAVPHRSADIPWHGALGTSRSPTRSA